MEKLILTCKHTSKSNMMAVFNGLIVGSSNVDGIDWLIWHLAELESKGFKYSKKHGGFIVKGFGFDRGLEIARALGFKSYELI